MSNTLILNTNTPLVGLNTMTYTVPSTGLYNVKVSSTLPNAVATGDGAGSGGNGSMVSAVPSLLQVQVTQNGTPIFTVANPPPTQESGQFKLIVPATAADVINIVFTSSSATDNQLNSVKSQISIGEGQF